jgi:hypothetical protein
MSQPLLTGIAVLILAILPLIFWATMAAHHNAISE